MAAEVGADPPGAAAGDEVRQDGVAVAVLVDVAVAGGEAGDAAFLGVAVDEVS